MEIYYGIIVFIFGLLFGSFYNVVGYRLPNGLSLIKPGSFCPKCNHSLKWYELIPVFSFLMQGGKCRKCKDKISLFYPLIEFLTGILFLVSYLIFGFSVEFLISLLISSFLVIVIVSDIKYLIIPDETTIFFSVMLILINFIFYGVERGFESILYGAFLFSVMYLLMLIGNKMFNKESLGGGDVKLMFFLGTILQPANGLFSIFLASVFALPVSLIILIKNKNRVIPFGPFILLSLLVIYLFNLDIISFFKYLSY